LRVWLVVWSDLAVGDERVHGALVADATVAAAQEDGVWLSVEAQQAAPRHRVFLRRQLLPEVELQHFLLFGFGVARHQLPLLWRRVGSDQQRGLTAHPEACRRDAPRLAAAAAAAAAVPRP
jgi:hypothetical protein